MKTLKLRTVFVLLFSVAVGNMIGCRPAAEVAAADCNRETTKFSDAITAYVSDPNNKSKCQAYLDATRSFINSSCYSFYGNAADRKKIEEDLAKTKCN